MNSNDPRRAYVHKMCGWENNHTHKFNYKKGEKRKRHEYLTCMDKCKIENEEN